MGEFSFCPIRLIINWSKPDKEVESCFAATSRFGLYCPSSNATLVALTLLEHLVLPHQMRTWYTGSEMAGRGLVFRV